MGFYLALKIKNVIKRLKFQSLYNTLLYFIILYKAVKILKDLTKS